MGDMKQQLEQIYREIASINAASARVGRLHQIYSDVYHGRTQEIKNAVRSIEHESGGDRKVSAQVSNILNDLQDIELSTARLTSNFNEVKANFLESKRAIRTFLYRKYPSLLTPVEGLEIESMADFIQLEFEPHGTELSGAENIKEYVKAVWEITKEKYNLGDDVPARIFIKSEDGKHWCSSRHQTIGSLESWIDGGFANLNEDSDITRDPAKIVITFEKPGGCGPDMKWASKKGARITLPTYSFETKLCGAITVLLLYHKWKFEIAQAVICEFYQIKPKELKTFYKRLQDQETEPLAQALFKDIDTWFDISKNERAKNRNSKVTQRRHEMARNLMIECELNPECGLTDKQVVDLVKHLAMKEGKQFRVEFWRNHCDNYSSSGETVHCDLVFNIHKTDCHYEAMVALSAMQEGGSKHPWCNLCKACKQQGHQCDQLCNLCGSTTNHLIERKQKEEEYNKERKLFKEMFPNQTFQGVKPSKWYDCNECDRSFPTEECYKYHLICTKKGCKKENCREHNRKSKCENYWQCKKQFQTVFENGIAKKDKRGCIIREQIGGCGGKFPTKGQEACLPKKRRDQWIKENEMLPEEKRFKIPPLHDCKSDKQCYNCHEWTEAWPKHQCYMKSKKFKSPIKKDKQGNEMLLSVDFEATQDKKFKKTDELHHKINVICTTQANGVKWPVYEDMNSWMEELLKPKWYGYTLVFHNGAGYDNQFVAGYCCEKEIKFNPQYADGTRLRQLTITKVKEKCKQIRIIDSLCHLPMALHEFSKTFNLKKDGLKVKKGEYCHKLNKTASWAKTFKDCSLNDVTCGHYLYLKPKHQAKVIEWYSNKHKENPNQLWNSNKWYLPFREILKCTEEWQEGDLIGCSDEDIKQKTLDAFGYQRCNVEKQEELKEWFDELWEADGMYDNWQELIDYCDNDVEVLRLGFKSYRDIIHDITINDEGKYCDPAQYLTLAAVAKAIYMARFLPDHTIAALPRHMDKLFRPLMRGGRTDCNYIYWKAQDEERAYHVDFVSLYPYINKYGWYPKGHPLEDTNLPKTKEEIHKLIATSEQLSLIWVDVSPNQDTKIIPVLPMMRGTAKIHSDETDNNKLMYDLMDRKNVGYTNLELKAAINRGDIITKIHKRWYWEEKVQGISKEYTNACFKMKSESDGYPDFVNIASEDAKDAYRRSFFEKEGIELNKDNMKVNPGMRAIAKLLCNALWGKWGERLDYEKHFIIYYILIFG